MKNTISRRLLFTALSFVLALVASSSAFGAATIVINNLNAAGVGFNDPTPVAPVGGNSGVTLGQQRLIAFQYAANLWGATITSNSLIVVNAQFSALTCTATGAVLGSAGAISVYRDFAGAPVAGHWYPAALAGKLIGADPDPATADINANFNVNLGQPGCLTGTPFYWGLDGNHGAAVDFVAVLQHEFAHGLGFQTFTNGSSGALLAGFPSIWDQFLTDASSNLTWNTMTAGQRVASAINTGNLVWSGPSVGAYAPAVLAGTPSLAVNAPAGIAGDYLVGPATFGPPLTPAGTNGVVVQALDPADVSGPITTDGCSALTNAAAVAGNIALIDRGTCGFTIKVKNAQNAGAIGVIIVDNTAGSPPPGLAGSDPTITIPSVRITLADGNTIKAQLPGVIVTMRTDPANKPGLNAASGTIRMFAPNPFQGGSSVSHFDSVALPNLLMEPSINADLTQSVVPPQDLTVPLLNDIGWNVSLPPPSALTNLFIDDVTFNEGNAGTTNFTFRVSLSGSAPAGGVTFDLATADGTAQDDNPSSEDNDYAAQTLTGLTIPAGSAGPFLFTVAVNGDNGIEPNETFFVNVTNVTGATVADGQGQGTILNEDSPTTTIDGTGGDDVLVVTATGPNTGSYSLNGGAPVPFSGITGFVFNGLGGNDTFTINNPAGGLFAPTGGIDFNGGGQPGDNMNLLGGGGPGFSEAYFVGTTTPPIGVGPGNNGDGLIRFTGTNTVDIRFTGLAPIVDTVVAASLTINATDAANNITVSDAAVSPRLRVSVDAFEPIDFDNKGIVTVNGGDGVAGGDAADTMTANYSASPAGLTSLSLNGDEGVDIINVTSNNATGTGVNGGDGLDNIFVGTSSGLGNPGLLTPVAGPVSVAGGAGGANLSVDGSGAAVIANYSITNTNVTRSTPAGFGGVAYSGLTTLLLATGSGANAIDIPSTLAGVATSVSTGGGDDTISIADGVSLNGGNVDGGAATDTLDYSAFTTPVSVNLGLGTNGLTGNLDGIQEVPPQTAATASGAVAISNYNVATKTFDIAVSVSDLNPADVTGFHIHRAPVGVNGPIIINLQPLAPFVPAGSGFTFNAIGVALPAAHEAAFLGGITYVNIHTAAAPGGLIRAQVFSTANVNTGAVGTATGAATANNFENVNGGSQNDSIVGNFAANILNGAAGSDTLLGGPGGDTMSGGNDNDVLVWSNGDGSDIMDGGPHTAQDFVQVNGNVTNGDTFTVGAGVGGRVAFARTSAGPFTLDIGTTETLIPVGIGGAENMTVNSLVGVADLDAVRMFGFAGDDTFSVVPSPTVAVFMHGGVPVLPTLPGDTISNIDFTGATGTVFTSNGPGAGTYTFTNRSPVSYFSIETDTIPTTTTITSSANPSVFGQPVTFTATVTGGLVPTGTVTFFVDGIQVCSSVALDTGGSAQCFVSGGVPALTVGTHTVTANYNPEVPFAASSGTLAGGQIVNKANSNTTVQPVINPSVYGDTVQLTASLTAVAPGAGTPQGTVSFLDGASPIAGCQNLNLNSFGSVTCTTTSPLPAGVRNITANYSGNANFNPSSGSTTQTVNKKVLNITASSHTVTYGDAAPAITPTITGFITGEGTGNLTTQPTCSTTYTQGSGVAGSPYPTSCSGGVAANYQFNYINGTVLVNKKALSLTAENKSRAYGAANPALTFTTSGFIPGDNLANSTTGAPGLSTTATATSPVGTYPITITLGTLASANYSIGPLNNGTLTVTGVQLTVTADNKSRVFGAPNPPLTFTVTGFVNGEGIGVLTGSPAISTTANAASGPGTYPITVSQGSLANPNYTFAFVNGTLTVTQAATTTTITNAASLAANTTTPGQSYAVNWSVAPVAPATGTPTGNVTVSDGTGATCSAAVAAGTCSLTSTTVGVKTITATYSGDANFTGSTSSPVQHNVAIGITGNVKQFIAFGTNTNLAGVTLTLLNTGTNQATTTTTDANGNYSFGVITLGQNYTITPSGLGKAYEATTRSYSNVNTNISGADFLAYDVPGPNAIPRTARVVSQTTTPGTAVTIPVLMTTTGVESSVAFTVQFAVGTLGIPTVACGTGAAGCNLSVDIFSPGKVGITIVPTAPLAAGTVQVARITFPTFPTNLTGTPVTFGDFPTARSVRNAENNPLPVLYWTDGQVAFTGGTLIEGGSIAGRVLTPSGQGLRNATVTLIDPNGNRWTATTGSFGNYQFENLELGRDYMVTVNSRRFRFATRTINLASNLSGVDMIGLE